MSRYLAEAAAQSNWKLHILNPVYDFCRVEAAGRKLQTADRRPQTADCRLQTADCRL